MIVMSPCFAQIIFIDPTLRAPLQSEARLLKITDSNYKLSMVIVRGTQQIAFINNEPYYLYDKIGGGEIIKISNNCVTIATRTEIRQLCLNTEVKNQATILRVREALGSVNKKYDRW